MSKFTETQRQRLLAPIDGFRVQELDGISHLAAWDVIAHLNRVFGFEGWDKEILSLEPVYEHVGQREVGHKRTCNRQGCDCRVRSVPACSVGYRCTMRLTVRNTEGQVVRVIEDAAMGTATNQRDLGDAHDLAVKSAVSYALKRCAKDLGDQFGLSLYNAGQQSGVVQVIFPYQDGETSEDFEVDVRADGIAEGDTEFGDKRGKDTEPEPQQPEPVREPAPAQPKATEKPEPTPPPEQPQRPQVSDEQVQDFYAAIVSATEVNGDDDGDSLRAVWKRINAAGALDATVVDLKTERQMALRDVIGRRVQEIETGQGAA